MKLKGATCIILPNNKYKRWWDYLIGILLLYIAIFLPLRIAFFKEEGMLVFETFIDAIFFVEIVLTFFTAYEKMGTSNVEVRHRKIAASYLKTWFWIDIFATIPFQLIELALGDDTKDVKLARVLRVPKLYRMVRLMKLAKMCRMRKQKGKLNFM